MEQAQEERIVTYVLRVVGVITVLVGLILVTQGIINSMAASFVMIPEGATVLGGMDEIRRNAKLVPVLEIVSQFVVIVDGGLCYYLAKPLSKKIITQ